MTLKGWQVFLLPLNHPSALLPWASSQLPPQSSRDPASFDSLTGGCWRGLNTEYPTAQATAATSKQVQDVLDNHRSQIQAVQANPVASTQVRDTLDSHGSQIQALFTSSATITSTHTTGLLLRAGATQLTINQLERSTLPKSINAYMPMGNLVQGPVFLRCGIAPFLIDVVWNSMCTELLFYKCTTTSWRGRGQEAPQCYQVSGL